MFANCGLPYVVGTSIRLKGSEMSDESGKTKKLSLSSGKLTLGNLDAGKMRTGPSVTGRKTVQVEVRRKRAPAAPSRSGQPNAETAIPPQATPGAPAVSEAPIGAPASTPAADDKLTAQERAARVRALQEGLKKPASPKGDDEAASAISAYNVSDTTAGDADSVAPETEAPLDPVEARRAAELAELREIEAGEEREGEER